MTAKLFSPITIKNVTLKNRIVMSPMCMFSADKENGKVTEWHKHHYVTRAMGGVGLVMTESVASLPDGKIKERDLGIWADSQIEPLKELVDLVHHNGSKIGIQISHAGRKAELNTPKAAPSSIPFPNMELPNEMSRQEIQQYISAFKDAVVRAKKAGFDIIEIHAAHGYLINQFLSPLTNHRQDNYGGTAENRYRFLREIIDEVKSVWSGPIFVRISANEYHEEGNQLEDFLIFSKWMKEQNVDLIDCSSGGVIPAKIKVYPGYQIKPARVIKKKLDISTGSVGLITTARQAEELLVENQTDLIFLGRELLRNPYWPYKAARELQTKITVPSQYEEAFYKFF